MTPRGRGTIGLAWAWSFEGLIDVGATVDPSGRAWLTTSGGTCHLHVLHVATGDPLWSSDEVTGTGPARS